MNAPLRIGIVGLGAFGEAHARTVASLEGACLAAVADRDKTRAERIAKSLGVGATFTDPDAMFASGLLDAVIIATRTETHVPLARSALERRLHVLLEKPAGSSGPEIESLAVSQHAFQRAVMVNHLCLFHSLTGPLLTRVRAEGFRAAHFVRHRPAAIAARFPEETPLSLLLVHDFYLAARMVNQEEPVHFSLHQARGPHGQVDMTWVMLRWADGRVITFHSHAALPPSAPADGFDSIEVFGGDYHTTLTTNPAPWQWSGTRREWPVALEISDDQGVHRGMLAESQRAFLRAVGTGQVPAGCRIEDAAQIQRWTERLKHHVPGQP